MTTGADGSAPLTLDGLDEIDFGPDGVVPVITQDLHTGEVLIPAFATREMVQRTIETGEAWYWSRSRARPWHKGEESGNIIRVREVRRNCYDNALLYVGEPVGPACHTGAVGCFYRRLDGLPVAQRPSYGADSAAVEPDPDTQPAPPRTVGQPLDPGHIEWLWQVIQQRLRDRPDGSYVVRLTDQGTDRIAKKVGEEAAEVIIAAKNKSREEIAAETADLWFHSLLLLADAGMTPDEVFRVLESRHSPR